MNDLKLALRALTKSPALTTVAVLSLSLAIGAGTAVFSLANGILLRSLPVPNPHELRVLDWSGTNHRFSWYSGSLRRAGTLTTGDSVPYPLFTALRERLAPEAEVFGYKHVDAVTIRARHEAFTADGLLVTDNFFAAFGATPFLGRGLTPADVRSGAVPVTVISFALWDREFGRDADVLGTTVHLNGTAFSVVGVMPAAIHGVHPGDDVDFYLPVTTASPVAGGLSLTAPNRAWLNVMARLRPAGSESVRRAAERFETAAQAAFTVVAADWMQSPKLLVSSGHAGPEAPLQGYRRMLLLLGSVVLVVVLVACANLAGLLLSRAAVREHEFAVRSALGSGRWRLARLALAESSALAIVGTGVGLLFAAWIKSIVGNLLAGADGLRYDTSLDGRVLGFAAALTLLTAILSGLLPALHAGRVNPVDGLKSGATMRAPRLRLGRVLVVAQIALSVILVSAGVLYVRTLINRRHTELGFQSDGLLLFRLNPRAAGYRGAQITDFYERVGSALARIPGVRSVGLTQYALLGHASSSTSIELLGHGGKDHDVATLIVGDTFFETFGIPLRVGRGFDASDRGTSHRVAVVNEEFVRSLLPGENPIGQVFRVDDTPWEIIGVAANSVYSQLTPQRTPSAYFSFRQSTAGSAWFALRTAVAPLSVAAAARRELAVIDPDVPLAEVTTQERLLDDNVAQERMFAMLCGSLGVLTVMLSGIGIFGLVGYQVARRTAEIGVRVALGAQPGDITRPILREAMLLAAAGLAIGLPAMLGLAQLIRSQLYGVEPSSPFILGTAVLLFFGVAIAASWLPARRAAAVDPLRALRAE